MRTVEIVTTKNLYPAGELVEGLVTVRCSKDFRYNAIHLTFTGRERTEIVVSSGKSSTTYRDERVYFTTRQDFGAQGVMPAGETRFPFVFTLPKDIPSSYSGRCGWVEYTLKAVAEISRGIDLKKQITIQVKQPTDGTASQSQTESIDKDGFPVFEAEMEEDRVCLGDSVKLRFKVTREMKIRGFRAELEAEEYAVARGTKRKNTRIIATQFVDDPEIERDLWMSLDLKTDELMPASFEGQILSIKTSVKLTLDIPWARDISIVMPIRLGYYAPSSEKDMRRTSDFQWRIK